MVIDIINAIPVELILLIALLRRPVLKVQHKIKERRLNKRRRDNPEENTGEKGNKRKGEDRRALERIKKL